MPSALLRTRLLAALLVAVATACALGAGPAAGAETIAGTQARIADLGRQAAELDIRMGEAIHANNVAADRLAAAQDRLAAGPDDLVVVAVAHQQHGGPAGGVAADLRVHLRHEGAGRVDHPEIA
ncbi:MAG TPA: hypothetical protein VL422_05930, partial [Miltoncostaea sp.]|nr:hypothetical protein [Miltoncostaea sp.]